MIIPAKLVHDNNIFAINLGKKEEAFTQIYLYLCLPYVSSLFIWRINYPENTSVGMWQESVGIHLKKSVHKEQ